MGAQDWVKISVMGVVARIPGSSFRAEHVPPAPGALAVDNSQLRPSLGVALDKKKLPERGSAPPWGELESDD